MSILECYLAAEKPKDGKPFTVCDVGTWFYLEIGMMERDKSVGSIPKNAAKLYNLFHNGEDQSERGVTLEELKAMPSNGGIRIIPKTKDKFVRLEEWGVKEMASSAFEEESNES